MNIAFTMMPGRGDMDRLLFTLAGQLLDQGYGVCGVVQSNQEHPGYHPCDMDIKVLPNGPQLRISQALGNGSQGCRLDAGALEQAAVSVEQSLDGTCNLLLINKFGKHEAQGRGLTQAIIRAVEMDVPVLCGLNDLNKQAFLDFAGMEARELPPQMSALLRWVEATGSMQQVA